VSTQYGLLAEAMSHPDDFSSVTYRLRAQAKLHDGRPVTPEDVIFLLNALKTYHPFYSAYYRHVTKVEKSGERDVVFTFDAPGNRELPQIIGQLTVLPKHWWEGTDGQGRKLDISATTLEPPLLLRGVPDQELRAGRSIVLERVRDYWGNDLNVNIGRNNFDELRYEYFRDSPLRSKPSRATRSTGAPRTARRNGRRPTIFRGRRQARGAGGNSEPQLGGDAGVRDEHPPRQVQGCARAPAPLNYAFDFEEMKSDLLRPVHPHRELFRGHRARRARVAAGTRA